MKACPPAIRRFGGALFVVLAAGCWLQEGTVEPSTHVLHFALTAEAGSGGGGAATADSVWFVVTLPGENEPALDEVHEFQGAGPYALILDLAEVPEAIVVRVRLVNNGRALFDSGAWTIPVGEGDGELEESVALAYVGPRATLMGTVSVEGEALAGVGVALQGDSSQVTTTSAFGGFTFEHLWIGDYTVSVDGLPDEVTLEDAREARVTGDEPSVQVDFEGSYVRTSSIAGSVVDESGQGIAATVALAGPTSGTTVAGLDGSFVSPTCGPVATS